MRKIKNPRPGEYVLVTKYRKEDLGDPWAIGFFSYKKEWPNGKVTYHVNDGDGNEILYPSYYHCYRITKEEADERFEEYRLKYPRWEELDKERSVTEVKSKGKFFIDKKPGEYEGI
ncbi:MAG: hypothetical protein K6E22_12790 [Treponema sp.]|nr:hypothetical protein [Treponema sp.]